jgi:succinoglycan biosynthesis transport protein ExoP
MNPSRELVVRAAPLETPAATRLVSGLPGERELSIKDLLNTLLRRKEILLGSLAFFICAGIIYCAFSTRLYKAKSEVQVQKESADALGLDSMIGGGAGGSDALDANITLQTQAQVLQSDSLALQVIKDLNLEQNPDFRPKFNPIGWVLGLMSPPGRPDPSNASLDDAPGRRARVLKVFAANLEVKPVSGTRLIDITYLNSDPKVAADVVNHLVQGLIESNFQTRHNATALASGWLGDQLSDLRKESEALQAKVVQLQRESGVFTLGQTDLQGREQIYTPVLDRLQLSTAQLAQAQTARIMKGALYQIVKSGDPELISGLSGSGMLAVASPGVAGSLSLIQNLRGQEAAAQAQLNELSAKFGPGYPKVAEVSASLEGIQASIKAEAARIAGRVKNDYTIAQQVENNAQTEFHYQKQEAGALNDKTVEYEITRQEATQSRNLYETLLGRLKEADLVAGLKSSNITLVDPARVTSRPAKPNVLLYLAASVAGGLFFGFCGALVLDATDTKIRDLPQFEAYFGEAPFAILPFYKENRKLKSGSAVKNLSAAAYSEAVRSLRTSIMRVNNGAPPQVILITSSVPGEGKSMLSANLAVLLAQQDKKVLLVDGDLRTPTLHRRFNLKTENGLSSILANDKTGGDANSLAVPMIGMPGLDIMAAGPTAKYPAELLASEHLADAILAWRKEYDFVIIDGAPVLPVTDSVLLSAHADLTLVVARYKVTERQSLERSYSILRAQGTHNIALVLNAVEMSSSSYYDYYGYNNRVYYGENQCAS